MSLHLRVSERAAEGLLRILQEQIKCAREYVANDGRLTDTDIHNARKSIKRARATLRLMRPALDDEIFDATNISLRDAARPLTQVRDAKVLLDSIDALRKHCGGAADCIALDGLEKNLQLQRKRARRALTVTAPAMSRVRSDLLRVRKKVRGWKFQIDDWDVIGPALHRIYAKGRKTCKRACEDCSDESLHEWRKQVKHLWYSLQILDPVSPGRIGEIADQAHKLADYLGDDHDLAVLWQHASTTPADEPAMQVLEALLQKRRTDLQDRAFRSGERIFAQKPKQFVGEIAALWQDWRESAPDSS